MNRLKKLHCGETYSSPTPTGPCICFGSSTHHAPSPRFLPLRVSVFASLRLAACSTELLPGGQGGAGRGDAMVFKGRFFSSRHKSSESSSSPDGSNSPRTPTSAPASGSAASPASSSSSRSDKKKTKSETPRKRDKLFGSAAAAPKSASSSASSSPAGDGRKGSIAQLRDAGGGGGGGASAAALSPILASSLGLNRIKTRSGPLPQEGQRMAAALGSSNLSRGQGQAEPPVASAGVGGRKGVSSWADSSSSGSNSRGKGKTAELPMRSAAGTSLGGGKSAVKGSKTLSLFFFIQKLG